MLSKPAVERVGERRQRKVGAWKRVACRFLQGVRLRFWGLVGGRGKEQMGCEARDRSGRGTLCLGKATRERQTVETQNTYPHPSEEKYHIKL